MDPLGTEFLVKALNFCDRVLVARTAERQGKRSQGELEEPAAFLACDVVLALRRGLGDQLNLALVQPQTDVELLEDFIPSVDVGQEDLRRGRFRDDIQYSAAAGVRKRLGGHDNRAV